MKYIYRLLIIAIFFVLVFIPRTVIGVLNYWLLFLALFIVVFLYLYNEYYVSKKAVNSVLKATPEFSIICEKIPFETEEDFTRGRLVVFNSMVLLYKKEKGKCVLAWSKAINEIDSIEFSKVSTKKKGFSLISKNEIFEFATYFFKVDQDTFIKALDFEV